MTDPVTHLEAAVAGVRAAWGDEGGRMPAARELGRSRLLGVNEAIGAARRRLDALHAEVAAEIARESRPELGRESLARKAGFRSPVSLIAAVTGSTGGDAARLVTVGEATAPRMTLTGQHAPARHPRVAEALAAGRIGVPAAAAIIAMLDRVALRADHAALDEAEGVLAAQAGGLALDQLAKIIARAEAHLDPDGVGPREDALRAGRSLKFHEDGTGMVVFTARLDPENGAPVKAAIEGLVTAALRARGANPGAAAADPGAAAADPGAAAADPESVDHRTIPQLQADALTDLCRHALGCSETTMPLATTTVVVRIDLKDLEHGTGSGTIDGLAQPVSAATVRRIAANGNIIPCVLGGDSEILDWGRAKRLFTPAQRLALAERDGGCAFCGHPPGYTEAHHIRWWDRDTGPTDLANGILLCTRCHHRIHDDGWEIRIDGVGTGATVWFTPPAWLDASRTARLGGRKRYDFTLAS